MALAVAIVLFLLLAGGGIWVGWRRYGRSALPALEGRPATGAGGTCGLNSLAGFAERVGAKVPPKPELASRFTADLLAAGYRSPNAAIIYSGIKVSMAAAFLLAGVLMQSRIPLNRPAQAAYVLFAALGGFRLPDFVLARRIAERQRRLRRGLPDALDLMIVCAEAGSAISRALRIVARELDFAHRELSDELNLMLLESNAGSSRRDALTHMAERTREPEIRKFVTVLVQAERFGTDIAEALRTHADHLRVRRRQDAEERAGKVSVKLVFPIFLFILPCMLLVTIGPAAIEIWKSVLPTIKG
jgi:tight adherence protein C